MLYRFFSITFFLVIALFCLGIYLPSVVKAQTSSDISVNLIPESPRPNQQVIISVSSYTLNIQTADIQWFVDGSPVTRGIGSNQLTITTKKLGSSTNIQVIVTSLGSSPITKNISITPTTVDILWQTTDSVVPPFYRGKALPMSESTIKMVAIPQIQSTSGTLIPASQFSYNWSEEYTLNQYQSGFSKDSFSTTMDYLNPTKHIGVEVLSRDGNTAASSSIEVNPTDAKLLLYATSPLYGPLYDKSLVDNYTVAGSDMSIIAEPYFFSPSDPTSSVIGYQWSLNYQPIISPPGAPNSIFLHRDSSQTGQATLDLSISNATKLFQEATAHLNLFLQ